MIWPRAVQRRHDLPPAPANSTGPYRTFLIEPQGQLTTAEEYNNLVITNRNGSPVYLRDVATATDTVQDERVSMRFWMRGKEVPKAVVILAVNRQAGANAVEVAQGGQGSRAKGHPGEPSSFGQHFPDL